MEEHASVCDRHEGTELASEKAVQSPRNESSGIAPEKEDMHHAAAHQYIAKPESQATIKSCSEKGEKVVPKNLSVEHPVDTKVTEAIATTSGIAHHSGQSTFHAEDQTRKQHHKNTPSLSPVKNHQRLNPSGTEHTSPFPIIHSTKRHDGPQSPVSQQLPAGHQLSRSPPITSCAPARNVLDQSYATRLSFPSAHDESFQPSAFENEFDLSDSFGTDSNNSMVPASCVGPPPHISSHNPAYPLASSPKRTDASVIMPHSSPKKLVIPGLCKLISKVAQKTKDLSSENAVHPASESVGNRGCCKSPVRGILPVAVSAPSPISSSKTTQTNSSMSTKLPEGSDVNSQPSCEASATTSLHQFDGSTVTASTDPQIQIRNTDTTILSDNVVSTVIQEESQSGVYSEEPVDSVSLVRHEQEQGNDFLSQKSSPSDLAPFTCPTSQKTTTESSSCQQKCPFVPQAETLCSTSESVDSAKKLNSNEASYGTSEALTAEKGSDVRITSLSSPGSEPSKNCVTVEMLQQKAVVSNSEEDVASVTLPQLESDQKSQDDSSSLINPPEQIAEENDSNCLCDTLLNGNVPCTESTDSGAASLPLQKHVNGCNDEKLCETTLKVVTENSGGLMNGKEHETVSPTCGRANSSINSFTTTLSPISRDASPNPESVANTKMVEPFEAHHPVESTLQDSDPVALPNRSADEKVSLPSSSLNNSSIDGTFSSPLSKSGKGTHAISPLTVSENPLMEGFKEFLRKNTVKRRRTTAFQEADGEDDALQEKVATVLGALQTGKSPALVNRDDYLKQIREFVLHQVGTSSGQVLYISGVPGTGKTFTVKRALAELQHEALQRFDDYKKSLANTEEFQHCELRPSFVNSIGNPFNFFSAVYINALSLFNPDALFETLIARLKIHRPGPSTKNSAFCRSELQKYFTTFPELRFYFVLVVDEADFLFGSNDVLYNLVNLPIQDNSKMSIIFIANHPVPTMETSGKVRSRLGVNAINFNFYNKDDLQKIVYAHLESVDGRELFSDEGIKICCTRLATFSGDARKALDIVRSALQLAEFEFLEKARKERERASKVPRTEHSTSVCGAGKLGSIDYKDFVTVEHFNRALQNFTENIQTKFIRSLPPLGKLIIELFRKCKKSSLSSYVLFDDIYRELAARLPFTDAVLLEKAIAMLERLCEGNVFRVLKTSKDRRVVSQSSFYQSSGAGDTLPPRFWRIQQNTVDVILAQAIDK